MSEVHLVTFITRKRRYAMLSNLSPNEVKVIIVTVKLANIADDSMVHVNDIVDG